MNHKRSSLLSGSYVALTKAFEPGNACDSTILSAPLVDGCVRTPSYARERAGTHHSAPRTWRIGRCGSRLASITTRLALQSMRSSPASQRSSSLDVVSTCVCWPVDGSAFSDSPVRVLEWKGVVAAFILVALLGCDSARHPSSFFCPKKSLRTLPKNSQGFERSGCGNVQ